MIGIGASRTTLERSRRGRGRVIRRDPRAGFPDGRLGRRRVPGAQSRSITSIVASLRASVHAKPIAAPLPVRVSNRGLSAFAAPA